MASDLETKAKEAFIDDHFELAVDLYSQAIAITPNNPELFAHRAQANIKLHNFTEAVTDANKAIELDPSMAKAYMRKGLACMKLEEYQTAKAALETGASLAPGGSRFTSLIKECDEHIAEEGGELPKHATVETSASVVHPAESKLLDNVAAVPKDTQLAYNLSYEGTPAAKPKYRHEFYQKPEEVVVTIFAKGIPAENVTAGVLGFATVIWALFELLEYHLLTLVCHILIVALAVLFLWSNASAFINTAPPQIPEVVLPKDIVVGVASALRIEINRALEILREIASGKDLKKFLVVIVGLWVVSILGNFWNFLTLFYIIFVLLHTVPVLYEKYEDKVDALGEKAEAEIKKHYAVFDSNVLSKIPRGPLKGKKLE